MFVVCFQLKNVEADENVSSREDLEWGAVLFDYYQKDYLNALVEYRYAVEIDNPQAIANHGQLLKGGMLLSYGMAEPAKDIFDSLLNENTEPATKNGAWYYLANLLYHKSEPEKAYQALANIKGELSPDIHTEYHYLATLIQNEGQHLVATEPLLQSLPKNNPFYAYMLFNTAIKLLSAGKIEESIKYLQRVSLLGSQNSELATLADRARHGIAQINIQRGDSTAAWEALRAIRTEGLYSNRALLTYAWTAIKLNQFQEAIPALAILNERSIAIPEVQEAKVLLAHLYEQEGAPRKALKSNLLAIDAFDEGIKAINEARAVIAKQDVPKEFIVNFEAIVGQSDWYAMEPTVDYDKLTPFVLDLISSNAFNETLRELSDLYTIQNNLNFWSRQANEHLLILSNSDRITLQGKQKQLLKKSETIKKQLDKKKAELKLYTLTLEKKEREKLASLIESTDRQIESLNSRIQQLKQVDKPYQPPKSYAKVVSNKHAEIHKKLKLTEKYIAKLEPVLRKLINAELDKHEDRMRYYSAQSRLAKARLYDATLMDIKKANNSSKNQVGNGGESK
ncbi:hypothetical protein FLL45_03010 [Aliikangiella marina]|uniref:Tetratricopeptide repeat protein n=1 Tax=Aliikangiella marina TaxID=1712262 RepID=A0A545TK41_9GAMM|nr:hypothetical protein FLL45_03010 [Aliikangiella marina]